MLRIVLFWLAMLGLGAGSYAGEPAVRQDTLLLPGLRGALYKGMSVAAGRDILPQPGKIYAEQLRNGVTYLTTHQLDYLPLFEFVEDSLVRVAIDDVRPESKILRWFAEQVAALPPGTTTYRKEPAQKDVQKPEKEIWRTAGMTWARTAATAERGAAFSLFFQPDRCERPGGMVVCRDSATVTDTTHTDPAGPPFERPPQPLRDHAPQPDWPARASAEGIEGRVLVQVYVDLEGNVRKWFFLKIDPVGWGFARAVENVVTDWKFSPAIQKGQPKGVWVAIPFNFKYRSHG